MSQAAEYRTFADECLGWAKTARSERERNIFLQMAQTWLNAAVLAEGRATRRVLTRSRRAATLIPRDAPRIAPSR